ncbi:hypothetical protein ACFW6V_02080 [Streptomyces sp. NPDC058734]
MPAGVVPYTYQQGSPALFVTDPALPDMDTLHHGWVRESRRLTDRPR